MYVQKVFTVVGVVDLCRFTTSGGGSHYYKTKPISSFFILSCLLEAWNHVKTEKVIITNIYENVLQHKHYYTWFKLMHMQGYNS